MIFAGRISQNLSEQGGVSCCWILWGFFITSCLKNVKGFKIMSIFPRQCLLGGHVTAGCHSHHVLLHKMEHDTTEQLVVACYTGNLGKETFPLGARKQSLSCPLDLKYMFPRKEQESNIKTIKTPRCTSRFCNSVCPKDSFWAE